MEDIDNDDVVINASDDEDALTMSDSIRICHLMSELDKTEKHSKDEQVIISELMASFIPVAMKKTTHSVHDRAETGRSSQHSLDSAGRDDRGGRD